MAEDDCVSSSYTEDDFYCSICQEVFKTPVRISACQHVFCRKCFLTAMKESRIHCPLCRGNVTRRERACPERAYDLENIMRSFPGNCRSCSQQIELYRMRQHYKTCEKYQDEFGPSSSVPSFQLTQGSDGHNTQASTSANAAETQPAHAGASHQPTFHCPLCPTSNLTRQHLLDHCNSQHRDNGMPVACPICSSLPWGDPTQLTRNFISHLNQMHQFDYEDFMNLQLDEETQYQIALEESFHVNI